MKRTIDVIGSAALLIVLSPVIALVAALVALRLGRPVIFRHERPGRNEVPFTLLKFRTMTDATDTEGRLLPDADRLTPFGRRLRATSLDELPELWNVLRGDMSLVGPRPLLTEYLPHYTPRQARRHEVRPGVTGWAQVNGRNDLPWSEKLELDVWYVEHRTLWLDIWILLRTLAVPFLRQGISRSGHATTPRFEGAPDAVPTTPNGLRRLPTVLHVTTIDLSLVALLLPQLVGIRDADYHVIGASAPGPAVAQLEATGIPHLPIHHSTRRNAPHKDLLAFFELLRLLRRLRPDILHTHNPKPGFYGRIAGRIARVPLVVNTVHGLYATPDDPWLRRAVVYTLERIAAAFSDAELVQNSEDLETLRRLGVPAKRLHLLGNGIDLERFDPGKWPGARERLRSEWGVSDDEVVVGFVGRLVAEKGIPELLAAVELMRSEGLPVRLALVGMADPAKPDALDTETLTAAGVMILGPQDPIEPYFRAFDILALPSHREGFPRVPMEAAAMCLPVVTTNIRGCREVVANNLTGILVPANDFRALTDALLALTLDPDLRTKYGDSARELAYNQFDIHAQIRIVLRTYSALRQSVSAAPIGFVQNRKAIGD